MEARTSEMRTAIEATEVESCVRAWWTMNKVMANDFHDTLATTH